MSSSDYQSEKSKWTKSDLKEIKSLVLEHKVWDIKPLPFGKSAMTSKWVHLEKPEHTLKSRLVGRGYSMVPGVDYEETFSPVAKMVTFRIFLTLVASYSLQTLALDVKTAFLNTKMEREVWMKPPANLKALLRELLNDESLTSAELNEIRRQLRLLDEGGLLLLLKSSLWY